MYHLRLADAKDIHHLIDIDLKTSELPWLADDWRAIDAEFQCLVVTFRHDPIGMAVFRRDDDETTILKFGVKPDHRRQGVARSLLTGVMQNAASAKSLEVAMVVPESKLRPGDPDDVSEWMLKLGFRAQVPLLRDHFCFYGEYEEGVKFTCQVPF